VYEDVLVEWGCEMTRVEVDEGERLPDWHGFDGIIAMGGPMGAYEDERLPWLAAEKRLIGEAVRSGRPFWGVCLGSQLLAASMGARVTSGPEPEVGVLSVKRTPAGAGDPVFSLAPDDFKVLQWHGDTFELPAGALRLAGSDIYEQQAFSVTRAYGLQFHIEIDASLARRWGDVPAYAQSLESIMGKGALPRLLEEIVAHERTMTQLARRMFAAWLERIVGLQRVSPG
jgi:GMP synthase (glutamine-hydrolysing)